MKKKRKKQRPIQHRAKLLVLGILAVVAGTYVEFGLSPLALLALGLLLLTVLWWAWLIMARRSVHVERRLADKPVFVGEEIHAETTVRNRSWCPVPWLEADLGLPAQWRPSEGSHVRAGGSLWSHETLVVPQRFVPQQRGLYTLPAVACRTGDLFAFGEATATFPSHGQVLVWPRLVALSGSLVAPTQPFGKTRVFDKVYEDFSSLREVRDYHPGDHPKRIHWRATARTGGLKVKEFDLTGTTQVYVMPDLNGALYGPPGPDSPLETAISVGASLGDWALRQGYEVGVLAQGVETHMVATGKGARHLRLLLNTLALVQAVPVLPLSQTVRRLLPFVAARGSVCLVTAAVDEDVEVALSLLKRKRLAVLLALVETPGNRAHLSRSIERATGLGAAVKVVLGSPANWRLVEGEIYLGDLQAAAR